MIRPLASVNLRNKLPLRTDSAFHFWSPASAKPVPLPNKGCLRGLFHEAFITVANTSSVQLFPTFKKFSLIFDASNVYGYKEAAVFHRSLLDSGVQAMFHCMLLFHVLLFLISNNLVKPLIAHRKPWRLFQKSKQFSNLLLIYYLAGCWLLNSQ